VFVSVSVFEGGQRERARLACQNASRGPEHACREPPSNTNSNTLTDSPTRALCVSVQTVVLTLNERLISPNQKPMPMISASAMPEWLQPE